MLTKAKPHCEHLPYSVSSSSIFLSFSTDPGSGETPNPGVSPLPPCSKSRPCSMKPADPCFLEYRTCITQSTARSRPALCGFKKPLTCGSRKESMLHKCTEQARPANLPVPIGYLSGAGAGDQGRLKFRPCPWGAHGNPKTYKARPDYSKATGE